MSTLGPPPTIPQLSADIWGLIVGYLDLPEVQKLMLVNKPFNSYFGTKLVSLLERLRKIDPRVPTNITKTNIKEIAEWAHRVDENQIREASFFMREEYRKFFKSKGLEDIYNGLGVITKESPEARTLVVLEGRSQLLDDLNIAILKLRIDSESITLKVNIGCLFLSRLPSKIFRSDDYQKFWKNLKTLNLSFNHLVSLPPEIGECQALQTLSCRSNFLQCLPSELEGCSELKTLDCAFNWLLSLPPELAKCQQLMTLEANDNYLTEIPTAIQQKMGPEWTQQTLSNHASLVPAKIPKAIREVMFDRLAPEEEKRAYYLTPAEAKGKKSSFRLKEDSNIDQKKVKKPKL